MRDGKFYEAYAFKLIKNQIEDNDSDKIVEKSGLYIHK